MDTLGDPGTGYGHGRPPAGACSTHSAAAKARSARSGRFKGPGATATALPGLLHGCGTAWPRREKHLLHPYSKCFNRGVNSTSTFFEEVSTTCFLRSPRPRSFVVGVAPRPAPFRFAGLGRSKTTYHLGRPWASYGPHTDVSHRPWPRQPSVWLLFYPPRCG